jgi:hypothetical protein
MADLAALDCEGTSKKSYCRNVGTTTRATMLPRNEIRESPLEYILLGDHGEVMHVALAHTAVAKNVLGMAGDPAAGWSTQAVQVGLGVYRTGSRPISARWSRGARAQGQEVNQP